MLRHGQLVFLLLVAGGNLACVALDEPEAPADDVGTEQLALSSEVRWNADSCFGACGPGCAAGHIYAYSLINGQCWTVKRYGSHAICRTHDSCYGSCAGLAGGECGHAQMKCRHTTDGNWAKSITISGEGPFGIDDHAETYEPPSYCGMSGIGAGTAYQLALLAEREEPGFYGPDRARLNKPYGTLGNAGSAWATYTGTYRMNDSYLETSQWNSWYRWQKSGLPTYYGPDSGCDSAATRKMWSTDQAKAYATGAYDHRFYDSYIDYPQFTVGLNNCGLPVEGCGDWTCDANENCSTCPSDCGDCGTCDVYCRDGWECPAGNQCFGNFCAGGSCGG